jgi:rhodanese-related sulfurtransferase
VHVEFARNVPLDQLDAANIAAGRNGSSSPLYVICRSGGRGKQPVKSCRPLATPTS